MHRNEDGEDPQEKERNCKAEERSNSGSFLVENRLLEERAILRDHLDVEHISNSRETHEEKHSGPEEETDQDEDERDSVRKSLLSRNSDVEEDGEDNEQEEGERSRNGDELLVEPEFVASFSKLNPLVVSNSRVFFGIHMIHRVSSFDLDVISFVLDRDFDLDLSLLYGIGLLFHSKGISGSIAFAGRG